MDFSKAKRVTIFCGHYGSGKTNIAVNYAMSLKKAGHPVRIADLDIVNPYFRTKDSEKELKLAGIELISSEFANSNVDLPALPAQIYTLVRQADAYAVMDVGGDDRGAYALGRYTPYILEENNYDMLYVVNFHRPLTRIAEEAINIMREIEYASGIKFTAIVNNTNLGIESSTDDIIKYQKEAEKLSALTGLPIKMTSVTAYLADDKELKSIDNIYPLNLQKRII